MNTFWILITLMALLALVFAILPLLRQHQLKTVDHNELNAAVVREQLAELQADMDAGKLGPDAYATARRDLERELLSNLTDDDAGPAAPQHSGRWAIGLFSIFIPALALFVYMQLGTPDFVAQKELALAAAQRGSDSHPEAEMARMVEVLAQRLRDEPERLDGWLLLARSYASMNQFDKAAEALGQARKVAGDTPELLIDAADMRVMASGGRFTDEVGELLRTALQVDPDNAKGRWLMGHFHYQHNDPDAAIADWQRAASLLPPDSESAQTIQQQIERARTETGAGAATATAPAAATDDSAAATGSALWVSVDLDPALRAQASPDDTLFVYARATEGPRMPLAIVRIQVSDLPTTVTLDDSQAMTPAMVLSNFEQVTVGARISKSGNAIPQSGDLEGIQSPVEVGENTAVAVIIDHQVP